MKITDYLRDHAHAIDIGESEEAAAHAQKLREAADRIDRLENAMQRIVSLGAQMPDEAEEVRIAQESLKP